MKTPLSILPQGKTNLVKLKSHLRTNVNGQLVVRIIQSAMGQKFGGNKSTMTALRAPSNPTEAETLQSKELLDKSTSGSLTVIPYHPGLVGCYDHMQALSQDRTIVASLGLQKCSDDTIQNMTAIRTNGHIHDVAKCSLSSDDIANETTPGNEVFIFLPEEGDIQAVRWAVLNCHEFTHVDNIRALLDARIEILVVVTYNAATRLYWDYAFADIHRLFCYVVIVNIAELGGSGIFAPFRQIGGDGFSMVTAGGQLFGARGQGDISVEMALDLKELRLLRREFSASGFDASKLHKKRGSRVIPVVPSEHYLRTVDREAGSPPIHRVREIPHAGNADRVRVAVAQLDHIGLSSYLSTMYRIRNAPHRVLFEERLTAHLTELESRCKLLGPGPSGALLDFLVFPEVFVPRTFLGKLQELSERMGTTIVAGVDYPDGSERENANECVIIRPWKPLETYRKITRSQYDAFDEGEQRRLGLQRGTELIRFVNASGSGFGVMICYDFSHLDLLWELNLRDRSEPLELLIVAAHNPYARLYRSCCITDSHRFYQYVVMANVASYGGSGVFGPLRTRGENQLLIDAGQGVETIAITEIDIAGLRKARQSKDDELVKGLFMRRPGVFQSRIDFSLPSGGLPLP
jgi:predicted amidohydrolase